ncbi:alpha-glucosidase/alpha-galactosidase [candidate division KSB1 bacterium]|nr:alpha-glucosidase/alpha-galactosidase [candidate division KSB1 bacterium]
MINVAMIGAGSVGFTRRLMMDILAVEELQDTVFRFTDIDEERLDMVTELCWKLIKDNNLPAKIESSLDRKKMLEGCDYVFSMVRVGMLEAFAKDIEIPLKYGVDQCVGDTLGPGGIFYTLRTIPVLLDFCADMREVCPDALFLNYSNPMAMNSWGVFREGGVRYVGLCHGVQGAHHDIAKALNLPAEEVDYTAAGINHQTWFIKVSHKGVDMLPKLLEAFESNPDLREREPVRIDILRRFGYYSTESNGHLSEYVPWYRKRPNDIERWIYRGSWIGGETGGYLRACRESQFYYREMYPKWISGEAEYIKLGNRSHEHGSYIIESLETGRKYRGHFNVENTGLVTNLPDGCVVEIPCYVDANGLQPVFVGDLPMACAATCRASISEQQMAVEAALTGDRNLAKLALLHDPLTAAVCTPEEVWKMADEMFEALAPWLPQF